VKIPPLLKCYLHTKTILLKTYGNADCIRWTLNLQNLREWNSTVVAIQGAVEGQALRCINSFNIKSCKNGTLLLLSGGSEKAH